MTMATCLFPLKSCKAFYTAANEIMANLKYRDKDEKQTDGDEQKRNSSDTEGDVTNRFGLFEFDVFICSNLMVFSDYSKDLPSPAEPAINFITSESPKGYPSDVSTDVAMGVPITPGAPQEETKNTQLTSRKLLI